MSINYKTDSMLQFEAAFKKTDYFQIEYEKTNAALSAFAWNNESNRYVWHDVNAGWDMWNKGNCNHVYKIKPTELGKPVVQQCKFCNKVI